MCKSLVLHVTNGIYLVLQASSGVYIDKSGPEIVQQLKEMASDRLAFDIKSTQLVPDDTGELEYFHFSLLKLSMFIECFC